MSSADGTSVKLPMSAFLAFLETRFGIIVDRPPAFLDDAEARAAARQPPGDEAAAPRDGVLQRLVR